MREFREDRLGDSRTALKGVNELLTALSILNDQIAWIPVQENSMQFSVEQLRNSWKSVQWKTQLTWSLSETFSCFYIFLTIWMQFDTADVDTNYFSDCKCHKNLRGESDAVLEGGTTFTPHL